MQYLKIHKDLLFVATPLIVISGFFLFWYKFNFILPVFHIFWLTTAITLIIIVTSLGNKHLCLNHDEVAKRVPLLQWLGRIFLLELCFIGAYWGISLIAGNFFPIMTITHDNLFIQSLRETVTIGFFPWPLYALIAVHMSVVAYRQQRNAYFSTLMNPFTDQHPHDKIAIIANIGARRCTLIAVSASILFMTMLITCPECKRKLHEGQHKFPDGLYDVSYCKKCGFRKEVPI